jgi:hypothetical protein
VKASFAQQSADSLEKQYDSLLEQQFLLKQHGGLTLFEQDNMTAEDRKWWIKRLEKENRDREEREKGYSSSMPSMPSMPSVPSMPSMPRR